MPTIYEIVVIVSRDANYINNYL